jgi:hypothetical protein
MSTRQEVKIDERTVAVVDESSRWRSTLSTSHSFWTSCTEPWFGRRLLGTCSRFSE